MINVPLCCWKNTPVRSASKLTLLGRKSSTSTQRMTSPPVAYNLVDSRAHSSQSSIAATVIVLRAQVCFACTTITPWPNVSTSPRRGRPRSAPAPQTTTRSVAHRAHAGEDSSFRPRQVSVLTVGGRGDSQPATPQRETRQPAGGKKVPQRAPPPPSSRQSGRLSQTPPARLLHHER